MKIFIVINGTGGCGKDSFVKFCAKHAKVYNFDSVGKIKEMARIAGWNEERDEKSRKFLGCLKDLTTEYNDLSFVDMMEKVQLFNKSDNEIMFIHVREPENIKRIVDALNAKTLLLKREGLDNITSNPHDANVDNYDYDYTITFSGLEDSEKKACEFISKLRKETND